MELKICQTVGLSPGTKCKLRRLVRDLIQQVSESLLLARERVSWLVVKVRLKVGFLTIGYSLIIERTQEMQGMYLLLSQEDTHEQVSLLSLVELLYLAVEMVTRTSRTTPYLAVQLALQEDPRKAGRERTHSHLLHRGVSKLVIEAENKSSLTT